MKLKTPVMILGFALLAATFSAAVHAEEDPGKVFEIGASNDLGFLAGVLELMEAFLDIPPSGQRFALFCSIIGSLVMGLGSPLLAFVIGVPIGLIIGVAAGGIIALITFIAAAALVLICIPIFEIETVTNTTAVSYSTVEEAGSAAREQANATATQTAGTIARQVANDTATKEAGVWAHQLAYAKAGQEAGGKAHAEGHIEATQAANATFGEEAYVSAIEDAGITAHEQAHVNATQEAEARMEAIGIGPLSVGPEASAKWFGSEGSGGSPLILFLLEFEMSRSKELIR